MSLLGFKVLTLFFNTFKCEKIHDCLSACRLLSLTMSVRALTHINKLMFPRNYYMLLRIRNEQLIIMDCVTCIVRLHGDSNNTVAFCYKEDILCNTF